jgi:hypothetical protein
MKKYLIILLFIIVVTAIVRFMMIPSLMPLITGQNCEDVNSGQIPPTAETRFLERIFSEAMRGETGWLTQVSSPEALAQVKVIAPKMTSGYTITWQENSGGLYRRQIRFNNDVTVLLTYSGLWTECPDLVISDEEIALNLQLMGIQILTPLEIRTTETKDFQP